jgi:hypothetical protein
MQKNEDGSVTLSREELYKQVWTTSIVKLAAEYGLSDVGFAKVCKRYDVPRPGLGYWAKKQNGQNPPQKPLPKNIKPEFQKITIRPHSPEYDENGGPNEPENIAFERDDKNRITVSDTLIEPHPLVAKTQSSLQSAKIDNEGRVRPRANKTLDVIIGPNSIDRAMRIMDSFIKALEKRSHSVSVIESEKGKSNVCVINGENIHITLFESLAQEERPLTRAEERDKKHAPWRYEKPMYRYFPNGRLSFKILTETRCRCRRQWNETQKHQLDKFLNAIIISMLQIAEEIKIDRLQREEARRKREAWEKERAEKLNLIRQEEQRLENFHAEIDAWHKSQRMRQYIRAVHDTVTAKHGPMQEGSPLHKWIIWATQQADRADPLATSPPSILDEKEKYRY